MTTGLGSYWSADITILRSEDRISLYRLHEMQDWLTTEQFSPATYILDYGRAPVAPFQSAVVATFGAPNHICQVSQYTIFAWVRPFSSPARNLG